MPVHHDAPRVEERSRLLKVSASADIRSSQQWLLRGHVGVEAGVWAIAVLVPSFDAGARVQRDKTCRQQDVERRDGGHKDSAVDPDRQGVNFANRGQGQGGHAHIEGRWARALGMCFRH